MIMSFNKLLFKLKTLMLFFVLFLSVSTYSLTISDGKIVETTRPMNINAYDFDMIFSTFFGGSNIDETTGIAVADDGSFYITGCTQSSDFPTLNAYNSTYGGGFGDSFVAKFTVNGSLLWSTYLGGNEMDTGIEIAVASDGSCYVTGTTESGNFPTLNAYNSTYGGGLGDIYVAKFSTSGSLLWSTYLGGTNKDEGYGITVASDGSCYVTGNTWSSNFPTLNAYNSTFGGDISDAFVSKFSASGSLLWSTYLGGSSHDWGTDAFASDGSCYVIGSTDSINFPLLNPYDNTFSITEAFITKFSASGSLLWSTYLGGNLIDEGNGIAVVSDGSCYVTGLTLSSDFPILNAYDDTIDSGDMDIFVAKISSSGSLLWSTYLGGSGIDSGLGIAVTSDDSCFVTGSTYSYDFPTLNPYDNTYNLGNSDVFITYFSSSGSLLWSTYLGGNQYEEGRGITIATNGSCYVTGGTGSSNFPILNPYDSTLNESDAFITKFNPKETPTQPSSAYSFLGFIIGMLVFSLFVRKRRKK
ncbi:MAG: hypothetical protein FK733_19335 [Asgard group archaeon]|nr:hypothetical protein [Asgard group archaeon]